MTTNSLNNLCPEDFTVYSDTTGAGCNLDVLHVNGVPANPLSYACVRAGVSAAGCGSPHFQSTINGVQTWTWGADNSAGGNFALSSGIALGTNDTVRANLAGCVTLPRQPMFSAFLAAGTGGVTGNSVQYTLQFDTVPINQGGHYSPITSMFTAPVAGQYFFSMSASIQPTVNIVTELHVGFNSSIPATTYKFDNYLLRVGSTVRCMLQTSGFYTLAAGEIISAYVTASGFAAVDVTVEGNALQQTHFTGWLVG
jgi:hypothetical protein